MMTRHKAITQLATAQAIRETQKQVTFHFAGVFAGVKVTPGMTLPIAGRTSTHLHPSRQGFVAVTPRGREVVILDSVIEAGRIEITERP